MAGLFHQSVLCQTLIGRTSVLAPFPPLLQTIAEGHGQVVSLSGDAGIGKSRLAAEIGKFAAAQGFLDLTGQCFPADQATPYAPVLDLLRMHFTREDSVPAKRREDSAFLTLCELLPGLTPLASEHVTPLSLEPEVYKQQLFTALLSFFAQLTAEKPLLVLCEDLHWSDEASLDFLLYLARWSRSHPLFLVLTYRTDENNPGLKRWLAQLDRERLTLEFSLRPLTRDDVTAMLHEILGQSVPIGLQDAMYALTEGNPFFVEEVLKSLLMSGMLVHTEAGWQSPAQGVVLQIPRSVAAAVNQRVAMLMPTSRQALDMAAVIGRRFTFSLLQILLGTDDQTLLRSLKELIAAQLVVEESAEDFTFRHALTRQAVYTKLLARERNLLHRRIAETIERVAAGSLNSHLGELAYHYSEAGIWEKAYRYCRQAGEQAYAMYGPRAAIEEFSRALEAASHLQQTVDPSLHRLRGAAHEMVGAFDLARADYEQALQLAQTTLNHRMEWQVLLNLGALWAERDYAQAGRYYRLALDLAHQAEDSASIAHSLNRLGNWHLNLEQLPEAQHCHQQALSLFHDVRDIHGVAETYDLLGLTSQLQGDLYQGSLYFAQATAGFRQVDDRRGLVSCLANQATAGGTVASELVASVSQLSAAESQAHGAEAVRLAREIDQPSAEAYALCTLAHCCGSHGDYDPAFDLAREGLQIAENIGHRQWITFGHWTLGVMYLDILALAEAQQQLEQAAKLAQQIGSVYWVRSTAGLLAQVHLLQQALPQAEAVLEAAGSLGKAPQTFAEWTIWGAHVRLACERGRLEHALSLVEQLVKIARHLSTERISPSLLLLYGDVLSLVQREAEAEDALETARLAAEKQNLLPLLWRIHLALGNLYAAHGRSSEAFQAFAIAHDQAEALARLIRDEWQREQFLSAVAARTPRRRPLTPRQAAKITFGGLTAREREIATLIAQGKSNPEIAELLVVGKRTVESHVSSILSKLGLSSRTQIALWVHEIGLNDR